MWPNPQGTLAQALRDFEGQFRSVRHVASDIAYGHIQSADNAKRRGNKSAMYGFAIVGNWLQSISRGDAKGSEMHRRFIGSLLEDHPRLVTKEWIDEYGRQHGLP